jgi:tellurite resistance protein TehA-like permease
MATSIISTGTFLLGPSWLSRALLVLASAAFVVLMVAVVIQLVLFRPSVAAGFRDPSRVFGLFAIAAGMDVLGIRLAAAGHPLATAILAGLAAVVRATAGFVEGFSFALWAFGTWWIPLLAVLGFWRHVRHRWPLSYEPTLWSVVFPLGMYSVATLTFGKVTRLAFMAPLSRFILWAAAAAAAWLAVAAALVLRIRGTGGFRLRDGDDRVGRVQEAGGDGADDAVRDVVGAAGHDDGRAGGLGGGVAAGGVEDGVFG